MNDQCDLQQNGTGRPKLLFVDDHHLVLDALVCMTSPQFEVRTADSFKGLEEGVANFLPDLAILDVRMPDGDGYEAAQRVLERRPEQKLMFLSMHTDSSFVKRALDVGAMGYVSKRAPMDELLIAIRTVLNGDKYVGAQQENANDASSPAETALTGRQIEVLRLISQGCSAKEIASHLNISVRTAEFHRAAIMDRLKLHSTAMMTRYAVEHGLA
ncbi:MAG TPA: response regulator transcription factor [Bryobacteraceae bacterium]